jgi:hypothetical protein
MIAGARAAMRRLASATEPADPEVLGALRQRWQELPDHARNDAQMLGRRSVGCEGTHGVFPRCNLACAPCYHSRDANRVRIDGRHTVAEVDRQMAYLRARRGPRAFAQLIGGEVTLLDPDDHAAALQAMRRHGREPMSMSHGDFDYGYLERLAVGPDGRRRLDHLSFAGHFDTTMFGRRGAERVEHERDLHRFRRRFCQLFQRLEREHGVDHYLAHNMTVTPGNVGQIAEMVRACRQMGFRMFSFQPAAFVGDERRWKSDYRELTPEAVWAEIERGAGTRLPWGALQMGDARCNRVAWGLQVGDRWVPVLDDRDPADLQARDTFLAWFTGVNFGVPRPLLAARLLRVAARHPWVVPLALGWAGRLLRRAGVLALARHGARPLTFVMHSFMDAADVQPAWELTCRGETSDDPRIRATQERLAACAYTMAHPETGALVPACVQHAVLDPHENAALRRLLPLAPAADRAPGGPTAAPPPLSW